jgi:hypothetical protein
MSKDEIDTMWQKAMQESIKDGEMYTRYHFAKLIAEAEREACAKVCDLVAREMDDTNGTTSYIGKLIRARGQA